MNDERLERQVKAALERDARPLPSGLRARVSAIPDEFPRGRRSPRFTQLVAAAGVIAAVLVLAAAALVLMGLHDATIGPASTATPSPQGTGPAVVAPASPSASSAIAPSVLAPVSGAWSGLLWSAPTDFPGPMGADGVVAFGGQLYAIGQLQVGSEHETAVWRSADGLYWTTLVQGGRAFAGAGSLTLLATPSELLAWGQGVPACSGPVTSQTCRPAPQIIMTSQDGVTWTRAPDVSALSGATIQGLAAGASGLVAVGETASGAAVIWTSADGSAWVREPLGPTFADAHFFSVRAAGPGFLISGGTGSQEVSVTGGPAGVVPVDAAIWWSTDGRAWTKATLQPSSAGGDYVSEIFVGADGLVAVGAATGARGEGAAWTSSDGRTWAPIAMRGSGLPSPAPGQAVLPSSYIVDDGTHMVAIGTTTGQVATWWSSTDGTTWTPLVASGSTATTPVQQGDSAYVDRWFNRAFVVPGGLVVVGPGTGSPDAPGRVWVAAAAPGTFVPPTSMPSALSTPAIASAATTVVGPPCRTAQLQISMVDSYAAAGTVGAWLRFLNTSTTTCMLDGWPTLIGVTATGAQTTAREAGVQLPAVALKPGEDAFANYSAGDNPVNGSPCPEPYHTLRVGLPGTDSFVSLPAYNAWYGGDQPACGGLQVTQVEAASAAALVLPLRP